MTDEPHALPTGPAAAAILAAAAGSFALGVLALAGDAFPSIARLLNVWNPTGPLSGVTDAAIVIWLAMWAILSRLWSRRDLNMAVINRSALLLFVGGLLLTFPPFMDLLQGK